MKYIYSVVDPYQPSQLTVHRDLEYLAGMLGYGYKGYMHEQFDAGQVEPDSTPGTIFVFEGADLKVSNKTTKDVRGWFPNSKLVALTGESLTYKYGYGHYTNNPTKEFEFYDGHDIDLWLDGNDEIVTDYRAIGLTIDYWMWTTSHYLIEQFINRERIPKVQDTVCLIGHKGPYRHQLMDFMNQRYRCQWGTGADVGNYDLDHLFSSFGGSRFVLGTTSPCWWINRSVKGFRDWLGPLCGTVLIYDNYPDVVKKYPCPIYDYDNLNTIAELMESIWNDPIKYQQILNEQVAWVKENTIAKQLYNRFKQYNIIEGLQ